MALRYVPQNLLINIFIAKDIDATDVVNIYEITDDPSGSGTKIASKIIGVETSDDPSFGDSYLFSHTKIVSTPQNYSFFYTIEDTYGNESASIDSFSKAVTLTPRAPDVIDFADLDFSGFQDLESNCFVQLKMNDDAPNDTIIDSQVAISATYEETANTEDRTVAGKINKALDFPGFANFIATNFNFSSIFIHSFSFNFWMKPTDATPGTAMYLFSHNFFENLCNLSFLSSNLVFEYESGGDSTSQIVEHGMSDNTWHMISITVEEEGEDDTSIKIYVDNIEVKDSGSLSIVMINYSNSIDAYISALGPGSPSAHYEGALDNFCIFEKVLTTSDINALWNDGDGREDFISNEFQTVFHYDILESETIIEDGDYEINEDPIFVDLPADGDWEYYRTNSNADAATESDDSNVLLVNIDTSTPAQVPLNDPTNLFLNKIADGKFKLTFNYNFTSGDPITKFNIRVDNTGDVSTGGNWSLDGTLNYSSITNRFTYTTQAQADGVLAAYYILPSTATKERFNDTAIIEGIADNLAPTVTDDFIELTLS